MQKTEKYPKNRIEQLRKLPAEFRRQMPSLKRASNEEWNGFYQMLYRAARLSQNPHSSAQDLEKLEERLRNQESHLSKKSFYINMTALKKAIRYKKDQENEKMMNKAIRWIFGRSVKRGY